MQCCVSVTDFKLVGILSVFGRTRCFEHITPS